MRRQPASAAATRPGIVTVAIFTCQRGDPLIGRRREINGLEFSIVAETSRIHYS